MLFLVFDIFCLYRSPEYNKNDIKNYTSLLSNPRMGVIGAASEAKGQAG